jgi:hypothetical protein
MHNLDSDHYGSSRRRISNPAMPDSSRRRWIGVMTVGAVIMALLIAGGAIAAGLDRGIRSCDVTIEIERLDLDGSFGDVPSAISGQIC